MPGTDPDIASLGLAPAPASQNRNKLDQEDFLALMITQMRNQDPLKPMENGEFIGQMAQFSTVSGIADMSRSIGQLAETFSANQALQAASMVGRTVVTEDDNGLAGGGRPLDGAVDMPFASPSAVVRIHAESGELVRELTLGTRNAGLANFTWDGLLASGAPAPAGRYSISAAIESSAGDMPIATFVASRVESVTLNAGGAGSLITTDSGARVSLSQVRAIR